MLKKGFKVAVLGAGSWGTALAGVLADNGHQTYLWTIEEDLAHTMIESRRNEKYLPAATIASDIFITTDLREAIENAAVILFVIPTRAIRSVATAVNAILLELKQQAGCTYHAPLLIHASKGLEQGSHMRISQVIDSVVACDLYEDLVVLSGPSHAEEVAIRDITTITAACHNEGAAKVVQEIFLNDYFRVYTNPDVIGVEYGGALKNIIALAAGGVDGLNFGDNTKAALITRGLAEIARFGMRFGAEMMTFSGLSGVGDLIVTCNSKHSRNWQAGYQLAQGKSAKEIEASMQMVVEGIPTTKVVYEIAQMKGIDMPITSMLYGIIYEQADVKASLQNLMRREGKSEASLYGRMEEN